MVQGVPINIGIKNRLENRLCFPIFMKLQRVYQIKNCTSYELSIMWFTFFMTNVSSKLTEVLNI